MKKFYRYVFTIDDKIAYGPWHDMTSKSVSDAKFDAHMNDCYINGDKNSSWYMEIKEVEL